MIPFLPRMVLKYYEKKATKFTNDDAITKTALIIAYNNAMLISAQTDATMSAEDRALYSKYYQDRILVKTYEYMDLTQDKF